MARMNAPESPVKTVKPPVTPEVPSEVLRRRASYEHDKKAAGPAEDVRRELLREKQMCTH